MSNPLRPLMVLVALTLIGVGCRPAGTTEPAADANAGDDDSTLTLAVIPKSTGGEFWETVERGAQGAADRLGVEMKWEGTVTETEIAEQNKIIENMINLGVDGMALAPLNKVAMKKQVANAVAAGIPVVVFDSAVDGDAHSAFVATNNKKGGALGADHLIKMLGDQGGKVMVMRYVQGTGSTEARAEGFIESATAAGLEIVADPYPDTGTIEGAKNAAANTLEGFIKDDKLELEGLFACNLYSTLGLMSALQDLQKSGIEVSVKFVGFDTSRKLVEAVQSGLISALVAQNPAMMGELAVETLVKVIKGETVEAEVDTGVVLVTKDALENDAAVRKLVGLE